MCLLSPLHPSAEMLELGMHGVLESCDMDARGEAAGLGRS